MSTKANEYVAKLEEFLQGIGVTGEYFCASQYERWRGLARDAFEKAAASAEASSKVSPRITTSGPARKVAKARR